MKNNRQLLLEWAEQSSIDASQLQAALNVSGVLPSGRDWRGFIDKLLLSIGALFVASGVVFFFAYNWDDLGRLTQFALVQGAIIVSLFVVWQLGLDKLSGKVALMLSALFVGVLLALIGQTYQTGADTYQLFVAWCALILPWAVLARFDVLWIFWLLLLNLSISLYYQVFGVFFHVLFGGDEMLWVLFVVNTIALIVWEWTITKGAGHQQIRWMTRLLATVSGGLVSTLAIISVLSFKWLSPSLLGVLVWVVWMVCAYVWYRYREVDAYVLAIGVLSVIAVVSVFLGRLLLSRHGNIFGELLIMSVVIIGLSALGAFWLRGAVVRESS